MKKTNRRLTSIIIAAVIVLILVAIYVSGSFLPDSALRADFNQKFLSPSLRHPFGTDYLGRDMFVRTIKGLSLSLIIGATASVISASIGLIVGVTAHGLAHTYLYCFLEGRNGTSYRYRADALGIACPSYQSRGASGA